MDSAVDSVVKAEIDVEVGLRQRILDVLQSRLEYALLLRSSINTTSQSSSSSTAESLRSITEECLQILESPLAPVIYNQSVSRHPLAVSIPPQPRANFTKTSIVKGKYLYVKIPSEGEQTKTFLLQCPTCSRTSFVSLQGLFNHGRLVHKQDYATHDSCIAHCAVPFDKKLLPPELSSIDDQDIFRLGTQVGQNANGLGILPGLQRLFEMAVGVEGVSAFPRLEASAVAQKADAISTLVSQSLGHHVETPALAPFLGKKVKRRGITTWEEDSVIDIDSNIERPKVWKKPRRERPLAPEQVMSPLISEEPRKQTEDVPLPTFESPSHSHAQNATVTRFHIAARVFIADWSMWLPPETNSPGTYSWMITLDSPAYTTNHTAYLVKMIVTSASSIVSIPPTSASTWPFFVRGYISEPFLARIQLVLPSINGVEQNMVLEHWVDVDPLKTGNPTIGDEQVVDLELDRRIALREPLQVPTGRLRDKARFRTFWVMDEEPLDSSQNTSLAMKMEEDWEYEKVLRKLLPEFPMTLKDFKPNTATRSASRRSQQVSRVPKVPYKMVSAPKELLELVPGRRKAIEWARAIALRDAYSSHTSGQPGAMVLTTADVYRWLEDEGEFPRPTIMPTRPSFPDVGENHDNKSSSKREKAAYCVTCGMAVSVHPSRQHDFKAENDAKMQTEPFVCDILPPTEYKLPMTDVGVIVQGGNLALHPPRMLRSNSLSPKFLVQSVDPDLTLAVRHIAGQINTISLSNAEEVFNELAPYALIAHTIPLIVKSLVHSAINVANNDREVMKNVYTTVKHEDAAKQRSKPLKLGTRLLTLSHLIRGLRRTRDATAQQLLTMISPPGISTKRGDYSEDDATDSEDSAGTEPTIKIEVD